MCISFELEVNADMLNNMLAPRDNDCQCIHNEEERDSYQYSGYIFRVVANVCVCCQCTFTVGLWQSKVGL